MRDKFPLPEMVDARVSGLKVLSEAMSDLTPDVKKKLIGYSKQDGVFVNEVRCTLSIT